MFGVPRRRVKMHLSASAARVGLTQGVAAGCFLSSFSWLYSVASPAWRHLGQGPAAGGSDWRPWRCLRGRRGRWWPRVVRRCRVLRQAWHAAQRLEGAQRLRNGGSGRGRRGEAFDPRLVRRGTRIRLRPRLGPQGECPTHSLTRSLAH